MHRARLADLVSALSALAGLAALFSIAPFFEVWSPPVLGPMARHFGHVGSVVVGLFLLFLSGQLRRRRHRAWQLTAGLLVLAAVANVMKGPHWSALVASGLPLLLLLFARRSFSAPSDPPTLFRLLAFVPVWCATVVVFGVGSLWLERRHITPPWSLARSLETVARGIVALPGPYRYGHAAFAHFFGDALPALAIAGAGAAVWLTCRPIVQRPSHSAEDWARARRLVEGCSDTLAYFALRADKSFFYASDGGALIAYGYFGGYALASGDPIGPPASAALAVAEFVQMCRERGWGIGFLAVREETLPVYEAHGLRGMYIGDEAILDCRRFDLAGPGMRPVRMPVHKLLRRGYTFELVDQGETRPETLQRLREISALHRAGEREHGFTMALGAPLADGVAGLTLAIVRSPRGVPEAFLRFVPCYGAEPGLSLDIMRRHPDAPNGVMEFLIAQTALRARGLGMVRLSLNFAAYGRLLDKQIELRFFERMLRAFVLRTDPIFQTRSLWRFNRKFRPDWLPRAIVYEARASFPRVALYYIIAEGFVRIPFFGPLLVAQPADRR